MNKLPDRWLPYKPLGSVIEGTRFIAFKVPLNKRFFHEGRDIATKDQFTPQILLDEIKDLGLIIDLTATTRYYNPREFEDNDVQYIKILTQGHQVPSHDVVLKFTKAVNNFLERNGHNDTKIGVHCTHGINRTGYLICQYMIREMKIEPKAAIDRFGSCRGYPIERDNYIESLNSLIGEKAVDKRRTLSIERDRGNRIRQNGRSSSRDQRRNGNYERGRSRSRDLAPRLPYEAPTTRRVSRVSRFTDRNDRTRSIEKHRTYDRPRNYEHPRIVINPSPTHHDHDRSRIRDRSHSGNIRNYDQPLHYERPANGNNSYRPRNNSNGRPSAIGEQPTRDYNRYRWTPRNQSGTNSMSSSSSNNPQKHR